MSRKLNILFHSLMHVGFLLLIAGSFMYYQERLLGNAGQDLFTVINRRGFFLIHGRLTHIFSQWMPVIAIKSGASLKSITLLFSCSTVLTFYGLFLFILYKLKRPFAAFGILMIQMFGISESYYHDPHIEIMYCMALSLVVFILLDRKKIGLLIYGVLIAVLFAFVILSYPPTVLFLLCVIGIKWNSIQKERKIVLLLLLPVILLIGYFTLDPYESSVMAYSLKDDAAFRFYPILVKYMVYFASGHTTELVVAAAVILVSIVQRSWRISIVSIVFFFAYTCLIIIFYGNNFQFEYKSIPLMFFIIVAVTAVLPNAKPGWKYILLIICFIALVNQADQIFYKKVHDFTFQKASLNEIVDELECHEEQLFIVEQAENIYNHSSFQTTLMFSSIDKSAKVTGIIFNHILTESVQSWQVSIDAESIRTSAAESDFDKLLPLVSEYYTEMGVNTNYFPVPGDGFKLVSVVDLCKR